MKEWRLMNGITQTEMAKLLGITQSAYSQKELDPNRFKPKELRLISETFNISITELYRLIGFH